MACGVRMGENQPWTLNPKVYMEVRVGFQRHRRKNGIEVSTTTEGKYTRDIGDDDSGAHSDFYTNASGLV